MLVLGVWLIVFMNDFLYNWYIYDCFITDLLVCKIFAVGIGVFGVPFAEPNA